MIFVSTGTFPLPFKRLVDLIVKYGRQNPSKKIIIQSGVYKPANLTPNIAIKPYFSFEKTLKLYQSAELIISAAGEASVFLILKHAKNTPIFMPRLKKFHDHVDNKQLATCSHLKKHHLAHIALQSNQLIKIMRKNPKPNPHQKIFNQSFKKHSQLLNHLNQLLTREEIFPSPGNPK